MNDEQGRNEEMKKMKEMKEMKLSERGITPSAPEIIHSPLSTLNSQLSSPAGTTRY
jgi:hypothetical protein